MEKFDGKKIILVSFVSIIFGALTVSVFSLYRISNMFREQENWNDDSPRCSMDMKLCPDGSYVGRTGSACEFLSCPGEERPENTLPRKGKGVPDSLPVCIDRCGDGKCQEAVCMGTNCPCIENETQCPLDCASSGDDLLGNVCPQDAKVCTDGSTVVRAGPNCEFAPCL